MPYISCPACHLRSYTAALHAVSEECPRCGTTVGPADVIRQRTSILVHGRKAPRLFIRSAEEESPKPQM